MGFVFNAFYLLISVVICINWSTGVGKENSSKMLVIVHNVQIDTGYIMTLRLESLEWKMSTHRVIMKNNLIISPTRSMSTFVRVFHYQIFSNQAKSRGVKQNNGIRYS